MTAREHRREIRNSVHDIAARYPRPVRVLVVADEQALAELRRRHTGLIEWDRTANDRIREYEEMFNV